MVDKVKRTISANPAVNNRNSSPSDFSNITIDSQQKSRTICGVGLIYKVLGGGPGAKRPSTVPAFVPSTDVSSRRKLTNGAYNSFFDNIHEEDGVVVAPDGAPRADVHNAATATDSPVTAPNEASSHVLQFDPSKLDYMPNQSHRNDERSDESLKGAPDAPNARLKRDSNTVPSKVTKSNGLFLMKSSTTWSTTLPTVDEERSSCVGESTDEDELLTNSSKGSTNSENNSSRNSGKGEMLVAMKKLIRKQQDVLEQLSTQNDNYLKELSKYHKYLKRMKEDKSKRAKHQEQSSKAETEKPLKDQKQFMEAQTLVLLRQEMKAIWSEIEKERQERIRIFHRMNSKTPALVQADDDQRERLKSAEIHQLHAANSKQETSFQEAVHNDPSPSLPQHASFGDVRNWPSPTGGCVHDSVRDDCIRSYSNSDGGLPQAYQQSAFTPQTGQRYQPSCEGIYPTVGDSCLFNGRDNCNTNRDPAEIDQEFQRFRAALLADGRYSSLMEDAQQERSIMSSTSCLSSPSFLSTSAVAEDLSLSSVPYGDKNRHCALECRVSSSGSLFAQLTDDADEQREYCDLEADLTTGDGGVSFREESPGFHSNVVDDDAEGLLFHDECCASRMIERDTLVLNENGRSRNSPVLSEVGSGSASTAVTTTTSASTLSTNGSSIQGTPLQPNEAIALFKQRLEWVQGKRLMRRQSWTQSTRTHVNDVVEHEFATTRRSPTVRFGPVSSM